MADQKTGPLGCQRHDLAKIHPLQPHRNLAASDTRGVEECLEHFGEPIGLIDDALQTKQRAGGVAAVDLALRHLGRRSYNRDRIAQVVSRHGHELFSFRSVRPLLHARRAPRCKLRARMCADAKRFGPRLARPVRRPCGTAGRDCPTECSRASPRTQPGRGPASDSSRGKPRTRE